ncbi:MAG: hypothetical protein L6V84_02250 [Oscillospiraceae bacterium]|nr:MAG: hypothetical protein L6V84_02250 [Oscillospiraceae bacterium]
MNYVRRRYGVLIEERTAEDIKNSDRARVPPRTRAVDAGLRTLNCRGVAA